MPANRTLSRRLPSPLTFGGQDITLPQGSGDQLLEQFENVPTDSRGILERIQAQQERQHTIATQGKFRSGVNKAITGDEIFVPARDPAGRLLQTSAALGSITDPIAIAAGATARGLGAEEDTAVAAETLAGLLTPSPGDVTRLVGKGVAREGAQGAAQTVSRAVGDAGPTTAQTAKSITQTNRKALEDIQAAAKSKPRTAKEMRGITRKSADAKGVKVKSEDGDFVTLTDGRGGQMTVFESPQTGEVHLIEVIEGVKGEGAPELLETLNDIAKQDVTVTRGTTNLSGQGLASIQGQVEKGRLILDEGGGFVTPDISPTGSQTSTGLRAVDVSASEAASQLGEDLIEAIKLDPEGFSQGGTVAPEVAARLQQIAAESVVPPSEVAEAPVEPELVINQKTPLEPLENDVDTLEELVEVLLGVFQ